LNSLSLSLAALWRETKAKADGLLRFLSLSGCGVCVCGVWLQTATCDRLEGKFKNLETQAINLEIKVSGSRSETKVKRERV